MIFHTSSFRPLNSLANVTSFQWSKTMDDVVLVSNGAFVKVLDCTDDKFRLDIVGWQRHFYDGNILGPIL
jgi:hypothetical protein